MIVEQIAVVVPARDERELLPGCLVSLAAAVAAVAALDIPTTVAVVLDSCTDDSADVLAALRSRLAMELVVLTSAAGAVGAARATGAAHLLARLGIAGTWLATTDADSVVPVDWLTQQVLRARAGARVVAGTVAVTAWSERPTAVRERAELEYAVPLAGNGHGHVHGANLGLAADVYHAVGGFAPVTHDEDVHLVDAALARGVPVTWAGDLPVRTSGRVIARAPHGFAGYLNRLDAS